MNRKAELQDGDRVVVDTLRRTPAAGEICVLFKGDWLLVKRVEPVRGPEAPKLRLLSANPAYPLCEVLPDDVETADTGCRRQGVVSLASHRSTQLGKSRCSCPLRVKLGKEQHSAP